MGLSESVSGGLREALEALRDALATEMDNGVACKACGGAVSSPTAALAKQLRDVVTQLDSLAAPKESKTDELKAKRASRQARVAKRAAGSQQRRTRGDRTSS